MKWTSTGNTPPTRRIRKNLKRIFRSLSNRDQFRRRQRDERLTPDSSEGDSDAIQPEATIENGSFDSLWDEEWKQNLIAVAVDRVKKQVTPKEFQVFDLCTNKEWPAARVAQALHLFRPQVYYLNKKVTRLIEDEATRLAHET